MTNKEKNMINAQVKHVIYLMIESMENKEGIVKNPDYARGLFEAVWQIATRSIGFTAFYSMLVNELGVKGWGLASFLPAIHLKPEKIDHFTQLIDEVVKTGKHEKQENSTSTANMR
jgi:hypothetical protein